MEWHDRGLVLSRRPYGDSGAVVSLLTAEHGRHAGLLRGAPEDPAGGEPLAAYLARGGYGTWTDLSATEAGALLAKLQAAALAGRGGAQFPAHRKLRAVRDRPGPDKVVVVNGSEHEPGSVKDRMLLARLPLPLVPAPLGPEASEARRAEQGSGARGP